MHAHLAEVRWVNRGGRRVALRKEVAKAMEDHLLAWRRWTHVSREAKKRYGAVGMREAATTSCLDPGCCRRLLGPAGR